MVATGAWCVGVPRGGGGRGAQRRAAVLAEQGGSDRVLLGAEARVGRVDDDAVKKEELLVVTQAAAGGDVGKLQGGRFGGEARVRIGRRVDWWRTGSTGRSGGVRLFGGCDGFREMEVKIGWRARVYRRRCAGEGVRGEGVRARVGGAHLAHVGGGLGRKVPRQSLCVERVECERGGGGRACEANGLVGIGARGGCSRPESTLRE